MKGEEKQSEPKLSAQTEKKSKNPLSEVIGKFCSGERKNSPIREIAKKLDYGEAYYRLIESGWANIIPSKALNFIMTFKDGKINFDAACKLLTLAQIIDESKNDSQVLKEVIEKLCSFDRKTKLLFRALGLILDNNKYNYLYNIDLVDIDFVLNEFLINYEYYGTSPTEIAEDKEKVSGSIIDNLPTIYLDYIVEIIESTMSLPTRIQFNDLWHWEMKHKKNFRKLYALISNHNFITSKDNLDRYKYWYLWEENFIEARILYLNDDIEPEQVKNIFVENLRLSLEKDSDEKRLNNFNDKMKKVQFKKIVGKKDEIEKILIGDDLDSDIPNSKKLYEAFWTFEKNKIQIGFLSIINESNKKLVEGISLIHNDTISKLAILDNLWEG